MHIRKLRKSDIESCISICNECFKQEGYFYDTRFEFESQFKDGYIVPEFYVCCVKEAVVGVMGLSVSGFDSSVYSICTTYVKPEFQRNGIGKALFSICINRIKELGGKCCFITSKKGKFFTSLGFRAIPSPSSYAKDGWVIYQYLLE